MQLLCKDFYLHNLLCEFSKTKPLERIINPICNIIYLYPNVVITEDCYGKSWGASNIKILLSSRPIIILEVADSSGHYNITTVQCNTFLCHVQAVGRHGVGGIIIYNICFNYRIYPRDTAIVTGTTHCIWGLMAPGTLDAFGGRWRLESLTLTSQWKVPTKCEKKLGQPHSWVPSNHLTNPRQLAIICFICLAFLKPKSSLLRMIIYFFLCLHFYRETVPTS